MRAEEVNLFNDSEILRIDLHPDQYKPPNFGRTQDGRAVIQQVGWQGCGAACKSMLIKDHGISPDIEWLNVCGLSSIEEVAWRLEEAGLSTKLTKVETANYKVLSRIIENQIVTGGSAILDIGCEIDGHFIILDTFSGKRNTASLRDPFHGWAITTTADAVLNRSISNTLQITPK